VLRRVDANTRGFKPARIEHRTTTRPTVVILSRDARTC